MGEAVARRSPNTTPSINTLTCMVDLILWYLEGKRPVEVYARAASVAFRPCARDDFQWMIVTFDDGSVATLGTSWLPPHYWPAYTATMEIDLHGTTGALNIDDAHRDFIYVPGEPIPTPYTPEYQLDVAFLGSAIAGDFALGEFFGPLKEESDSFLRHVLGTGGVGLATGAHARNVLALTMAADRSANTGKPVQLSGRRSAWSQAWPRAAMASARARTRSPSVTMAISIMRPRNVTAPRPARSAS